MNPKTFEKRIQRYDKDLRMVWGLRPDQKEAIDRGYEIPYSERLHCWTVCQKLPDGTMFSLRPLLDPEGRPREPYDQDMLYLQLGRTEQILGLNGQINPIKNARWEKEVLGRMSVEEEQSAALDLWEERTRDEHLDQIVHYGKKAGVL